ncbi:MAG: universal stress protein [Nitritalea sp.]
MKKILVPIDFSPYAAAAFETAMRIAAKGESSIIAVNVVGSTLDWASMRPEAKEKETKILDQLQEAKAKLGEFLAPYTQPHVPIDTQVLVGIPYDQVCRLAAAENTDLIVLGAYGQGYAPEKHIGSHVQRILREAHCPVLAVKKALNGNALRKMVFAAKFHTDSKEAFLRLRPLIRQLRCSVHFLFINTPEGFTRSADADAAMQQYAQGLEDIVIHKHIYNDTTAEAGILNFAEKLDAGFIAFATNERKNSRTYQIGHTETVLFKGDYAVLSVKFT